MGQQTANVVRLPTRLVEERESAELLRRWGIIRRDLHGTERAAALLEWGFSVVAHNDKYGLAERDLG